VKLKKRSPFKKIRRPLEKKGPDAPTKKQERGNCGGKKGAIANRFKVQNIPNKMCVTLVRGTHSERRYISG